MNANSVYKNQITWINTMKLMSCFFVFVSHYYSCFFFLDASTKMSEGFRQLVTAAQGLANGTLWVMIFCFVSGVFCAKKQIISLKGLLYESINRYFRLIVPILFIGIIIFIMSWIGLLQAQSARDVFGCPTFFDEYYVGRMKVAILLRGIFLFDKRLNAPLWMMGMLYAGNIIIYVCNYISHITKRENIKYLLYTACACVCVVIDELFVLSCICGAIFTQYIIGDEVKKPLRYTVALISFALLLMAFANRFSGIIYALSMPFDLDPNSVKCVIAVCALMLFIRSIPQLCSVLSLNFLKVASKYSFSVFLVHWPIMCTLSILLYKGLMTLMPYDLVFITVFIVTVVVVGIVSWTYSKLFDKPTEKILNKIYSITKNSNNM